MNLAVSAYHIADVVIAVTVGVTVTFTLATALGNTEMFLEDLRRLMERLEKQPAPTHGESFAGFSH